MLPTKRPHLMINSNTQLFPSQPPLFDYHSGATHIEPFTSILEKVSRNCEKVYVNKLRFQDFKTEFSAG